MWLKSSIYQRVLLIIGFTVLREFKENWTFNGSVNIERSDGNILEREREAKEDLIKELGGRCQRDGRIAKAPAMTFHELFKKAREDRGRPFLRTSLGRRWIRFRKTNRREEVFGLIRRKVMLLDAACHNEVTAKEKKLGRKLLREEIHLNAGRNILR